MKKLLQIVSALILTYTVSAQDQLYNNSFNMWGTDVLANHPSIWMCAYEVGIPANSPVKPIEKSSDATNLLSSVKLTTIDFQSQTQTSFVLLGDIGNQGPEGGTPFSLAADSIIFDAQFDIETGDSANVYLFLSNSGIQFDFNVFLIGGSSNGWTRMAFPINPLNLTPDTLFLGFTSSDTRDNTNPVLGSWIMIDNIRFSDGANYSSPIPNPSFEEWEDITAEGANEWFTLNSVYAGFGGSTAFKSTDAQEGTYAINLIPDSVTLMDGTQFVPGVAIYGFLDINTGNTTGKSFTATPTSMTGYYKWTPVNSATGSASVEFKAAGVTVGAGVFSFTSAQNSYTQFTIPLTLTGAPDTVIVMFDAGGEVGSSLLIDNIQFTGGDVGVKQIALSDATIGVYPNPTTSDANLKVGLPKTANVSYVVLNALGQQIESDNLGSMKDGVHNIKLNTGNYSTGVYFVKVKIGENTMTQKVIVK